MSATLRFLNRFVSGMKRGIENAFRSKDTYDYSLNGRIIYNDDGTWSWQNAKGTKFTFDLKANYGQSDNYKPVGSCYVNGTLIIHSVDDTGLPSPNSEIGLLRQDQYNNWVYRTAFNDIYDPYGDKLNFNNQFNHRMHAVQENNAIEREYWNDDFNEPRVFNTLLGAVNPDDFVDGPYNPVVALGNVYPSYYSVHGISQMPDLTWGFIKYKQNVPGTLKSGQRQYAYRYVHKTGYTSPWSYLTNFIFVTDAQIDAANWTKYQMGVSGIVTNKGHRMQITHLDERFQQIQVAAIYWQTNDAPDNASIVFTGDIDGPDIEFDHVDDMGERIDIKEINQKFFNIKNAKTQSIHYDNYYHIANVELYQDLEIETKDITVEPVVRRMLSDETGASQNVPLTHQVPKNTSLTRTLFDGVGGSYQEQFTINDDYINYKGTQWAHLFPGHFRRERYPYGIVIWNRKGQPLFVKHITDYQFPEQYKNEFVDTRLDSTVSGNVGAVGDYVLVNKGVGSAYQITDDIQQLDNYALNIMGIKFGNIDLTDILFDDTGKLQVSGFSIVRMDRIASILAQGLVCNTIRNSTGGGNYTDEVRPLPTSWNYLNDEATNPTGPNTGQMQDNQALNAKGNWHTFECPDYFLDQTIFQNASINDFIRLVGAASSDSFGSAASVPIHLNTGGVNNYHYYSKNYKTLLDNEYDSLLGGAQASEQLGTAQFGQSTNPSGSWTVDKLFANARNIDGIDGAALFFREYSGIQNYRDMVAGDPNDDFSALLHNHALLLQLSLITSSIRESATQESICYYIANYIKEVAIPQMSKSLLENRVYNGIGHFVPINANTIDKAFDVVTGKYVFNNVEVWGGDCYNDFYSFARLLPAWFYIDNNGEREHIKDCPYNDTHHNPDYAIGLCFPCESKYNHSMRSGDEYAKVGTEPMSTYCGDTTVFNNGLFYATEDDNKFESFNLNKVLSAKNTVSVYNSKRALLNPDITDFPLIEMYAGPKFYGENIDSYRRFFIDNFQFANGEHGEIISLNTMSGVLYVFQQQAFARVRFNERELINTTTGTVNTGTGKGYSGHDYVSTEYGCQHQFSIVNSGRSLYFPDAEKGKWCRFGQDGLNFLSDTYDARWMRSKLREYWYVDNSLENDGILGKYYDNPTYLGGVHGVFDHKNNSVILTFTGRKIVEAIPGGGSRIVNAGEPITIEYSEINNAFQTYHSFTPRWYFSVKQNYLSMKPDDVSNRVYSHDEGLRGSVYDQFVNAKLGFYINPQGVQAKVFDNAMLEANGAIRLLESVDIKTNIVNSQIITLNDAVVDSRPSYREGIKVYPMMALGQSLRLRGQWAYSEYTVNNDGTDDMVQLTQQETKYRLSSRV